MEGVTPNFWGWDLSKLKKCSMFISSVLKNQPKQIKIMILDQQFILSTRPKLFDQALIFRLIFSWRIPHTTLACRPSLVRGQEKSFLKM